MIIRDGRNRKKKNRIGDRYFWGGRNSSTGGGVNTILKELNFCNDDGDQADPDLVRIGNAQTFSGTPPWPFIEDKAKYYYPMTNAEPIKPKREYTEQDLINEIESIILGI